MSRKLPTIIEARKVNATCQFTQQRMLFTSYLKLLRDHLQSLGPSCHSLNTQDTFRMQHRFRNISHGSVVQALYCSKRPSSYRLSSHLAKKSIHLSVARSVQTSTATVTAPPAPKEATPSGDVKSSNKEQRQRDIQIIRRLLPNIWPKGETSTKARVVIALGLLAGGKVRVYQLSEPRMASFV